MTMGTLGFSGFTGETGVDDIGNGVGEPLADIAGVPRLAVVEDDPEQLATEEPKVKIKSVFVRFIPTGLQSPDLSKTPINL